jgi:hypothetical protein
MSGAAILSTWAGSAAGSKAAAAALACAASDADTAALLVDLAPGRAPRPALIATVAARELEERLAIHRPLARVAARGQLCHIALPANRDGLEQVAGALALVRNSLGVVHLPPELLQPALGDVRIRASGVLLRADLDRDRALAALAVRDLLGRGLRVMVLRHPLAWLPSRRALFGVLPNGAPGGLPARLLDHLLGEPASAETVAAAVDAHA